MTLIEIPGKKRIMVSLLICALLLMSISTISGIASIKNENNFLLDFLYANNKISLPKWYNYALFLQMDLMNEGYANDY